MLDLTEAVDDDDTEVGAAPEQPDTDRGLVAAMCDDTAEWDDTDRDVRAQGTIDTTPAMFEDTDVMIVDVTPDPDEPAATNRLVVTFRATTPNVTFKKTRATTADEWPPEPRAPAQRAPQIRERAFKRAGVYRIVTRPDTKN